MTKLIENDLDTYKSDIIDYLSELTLRERLEVYANVFIYEGVSLMLDQEDLKEEELGIKPIIELVLDHTQEKGNTLGGSLAMQGITILGWLDS